MATCFDRKTVIFRPTENTTKLSTQWDPWGCNRYLYVCAIQNNFLGKALSVKEDISETHQYLNPYVLVLIDGACLTSYEFDCSLYCTLKMFTNGLKMTIYG